MKYKIEEEGYGTNYFCISDNSLRAIRVTRMVGGFFHVESITYYGQDDLDNLLDIEKSEFEDAYKEAIAYFEKSIKL